MSEILLVGRGAARELYDIRIDWHANYFLASKKEFPFFNGSLKVFHLISSVVNLSQIFL